MGNRRHPPGSPGHMVHGNGGEGFSLKKACTRRAVSPAMGQSERSDDSGWRHTLLSRAVTCDGGSFQALSGGVKRIGIVSRDHRAWNIDAFTENKISVNGMPLGDFIWIAIACHMTGVPVLDGERPLLGCSQTEIIKGMKTEMNKQNAPGFGYKPPSPFESFRSRTIIYILNPIRNSVLFRPFGTHFFYYQNLIKKPKYLKIHLKPNLVYALISL